MAECPVVHIHRVTDSASDAPPSQGVCPVQHSGSTAKPNGVPAVNKDDHEVEELDIDVDSISLTPSMQEYKKLKKVMGMITKFYQDGSRRKGENYETMVEQILKLEEDQQMCEEQLKALSLQSSFLIHPKAKEYKKNLQEELDGLLAQKAKFVALRDDFKELFEWSKMIVEICEWLELHMNHYCKEHIPDLPPQLFEKMKPIPELTPEQTAAYSKGLAEITFNLNESQDFFQASVDGRLNKYHAIEKQLILEQLKAISKYPEDSPRRQHVEAELKKDLEYVENNMKENPSGTRRKEKMLKNHQEFFKVLKYHREKLGVFGEIPELKYDPKYDHFNDQ